jgi:hypothetical protein
MSMSIGGDQKEGKEVLTMFPEKDSLTAEEAQTLHLRIMLSFSRPRDLSHPVGNIKSDSEIGFSLSLYKVNHLFE